MIQDAIQAITDNGFELALDTSIYARAAVMKALRTFPKKYRFTFFRENNVIRIYCIYIDDVMTDFSEDANDLLDRILQSMIRYDTMRETSSIRQLLIGRALYGTCIDMNTSTLQNAPVKAGGSWRDDPEHILESWEEST